MLYRHLTPGPGFCWDIAGTEEHAAEAAFARRVSRDNGRLSGNLRAKMNRNSKANRLRYGVESPHASFTLYPHAEDEEVSRVLKTAAWLPGFEVEVKLNRNASDKDFLERIYRATP